MPKRRNCTVPLVPVSGNGRAPTVTVRAPTFVMACCGDVPTLETLATVELLRHHCPSIRVRVVNSST